MPGFLFDSYALLAFFQKERGAETVLKFLKESKNNSIEPLICVINLGEILYLTKRRFGDAKKIEILGRIYQLSFNIIPATNDLVFEAAEIKADYPISYADSFVVACAIDQSAEIVTGRLYSTEAVLTEVLYILNFSITAQSAALDFVLQSVVEIVPSNPESLKKIKNLMKKYADLPMDFADATIVCLATQTGMQNIVTFDKRDFAIYKLPKKKSFIIMP